MPDLIHECPVCKGKGKQTLSVTVVGNPDSPQNGDVEIGCVMCEGGGKVQAEDLAQYEFEKNAWCKCGNPSEQERYWPDNTNDLCNKHCWTCADCNKLLQIG